MARASGNVSKIMKRDMPFDGSTAPLPRNAPSQTESTVKANFMSPTMASSKKVSASSSILSGVSTPTSPPVSIGKASTGKWMTSAVKRVGLRRMGGDGTPRSKKEGSKGRHNAVTFPDKIVAQIATTRGRVAGAVSPEAHITRWYSRNATPVLFGTTRTPYNV
ncbi:MAG: hypothetical protein Q9222_006098 [Ikaeria aurantiellina]